jgi:hypothetical protein
MPRPRAFTPSKPETVTEYEGGFKSELFDRMLRFNLALFYDDYRNVQRSLTLPAPGGAGYAIVTNAAKARLWGVEGEATLRLSRQFAIDGNFAYLNTKYMSFSDFLLGDRSGEPWPAPKWTYTVNGRYEQPVGFGTLAANLQWVFTGTQNLQPQALNRDQNVQKGYGLLKGTLGLQFPDRGLEISAFGRNLTAKKYYVTGISLESVGLNTLLVAEPRTYGIQITQKFGGEIVARPSLGCRPPRRGRRAAPAVAGQPTNARSITYSPGLAFDPSVKPKLSSISAVSLIIAIEPHSIIRSCSGSKRRGLPILPWNRVPSRISASIRPLVWNGSRVTVGT